MDLRRRENTARTRARRRRGAGAAGRDCCRSRWCWSGEEEGRKKSYANGALEDVLAVLGELVDGDDDGAALEVRGGEEGRNEVVVAEKSDADLEGRPVVVGEDFGAIDLDAAVGLHVIWVKES